MRRRSCVKPLFVVRRDDRGRIGLAARPLERLGEQLDGSSSRAITGAA
jgi:hypothetical protein